ncbi:hypothetical protein [Terriglobus saanensis]|uniref:Uncharacterized protein n=1 Tax=Terriglobus saanensis (strain ATCC BAA-1853 / DSM 23119 / SP1PR4) TaxID=401053 RepID=E8V4Y5_TERSS|nr:hypothetical protein [Terriglobus saanensis]ADV82613.1 hypothetical protein AciPR4_1807 [Terriglobus saanensis SP1PR4]
MERTKLRQNAMLANAREELHDLSQPVTAVLCLLELAKLQGDDRSMREGIDNALKECARLMRSVQRMRFALGEPEEEEIV